MDIKLGDVQTTALIPLAIKANETLRESPRIRDDKAVEIIRTLGIDTEPYDKVLSHECVVARTVMLDRQLKQLLEQYPDAAVINLGCGLDNRFSRVDNGTILWFDIDLPDAIEVRRRVFEELPRVKMIAASVLDGGWTEQIPRGRFPILLAEGLFMYFTMEEIRSLLHILRGAFKSGILIAELNHPMLVKNQKHHDTVRNTNAVFKSGTKSGREIAALCGGIAFVEEHSFNEEMRKFGLRDWFFTLLLSKMNDRWATFRW